MVNKCVLIFLIFFLSTVCTFGQQDSISLQIDRRKLSTAIITESLAYVGVMSYLQYVWYKDKERVPFQLYNDAKGYQQIDKFGHAFGAYWESYIGYYWLKSANVPKDKALLFGGTLGIILQTPIEIFDGIYEGWGFSWPDMIANTAGSTLFIGQELLFDKQLVLYKFSFNRSNYAKQIDGFMGDTYLESLLYDYNGHSYWLSMNANRIKGLKQLPDWLNIAVGYSANGMYGEFENKTAYKGIPIPETERYRQYLLSLDIDWTKIPTNAKWLKTIFKGLMFVKIPFPAFEVNTKNGGGIRGYWLYF